MGFFSKICAKTYKPVVHQHRGYPELSKIVVLFPNGKKMQGIYDGYGRVDGKDLCPGGYNEEAWTEQKWVLASAYKGEKYDELGPSHDELGQGHFMADEFLDHCMKIESFKSPDEYEQAFNKLADW